MNNIFKITKPFRVPDGTLVSPFLNPRDSTSGLPSDLFDGFSLAAGIIEPNQKSKIQILPFVTQVTFVRRGNLQVRVKEPKDSKPFSLSIAPDQAVLTEAMTFFQLINVTDEPCEVLYIVSPAYLFEMVGERIIYDDAVVLDEDWDDLEGKGWRAVKPLPTIQQRKETEQRLSK